jgi:hypothetical protein
MPDLATVLTILFMLTWVIFAVAALYFYRCGDMLFRLLYERFPDYYDALGRPRYYTYNFFRNMRAQTYLQNLFSKGIPADLPQDDDILAIALSLRKFNLLLVVLFMVAFLTVLAMFIFAPH